MFTFPIPAVRTVIERGTSDAAANGGFRNPYYGLKPGEGEKPGLWLVGDNGVYVMSNGKLSDGGRPLVVYSEECHRSAIRTGSTTSAVISAATTASSSSRPSGSSL